MRGVGQGQGGATGAVGESQAGFRRHFEGAARMRVVVECSGSTPWVVRLLEELGHEVVVVNPRRVRLIAESTLKCDRVDAEILARLSRLDPEMLRPVYQRSYEGQLLRTRLRLRSSLVRARATLINQVRYAAGSRLADVIVQHEELRSALRLAPSAVLSTRGAGAAGPRDW